MVAKKYKVIVGNIGKVYYGISEQEARECFAEYANQSEDNYGRAAGEAVTLFEDGEVIDEIYYGDPEDYVEEEDDFVAMWGCAKYKGSFKELYNKDDLISNISSIISENSEANWRIVYDFIVGDFDADEVDVEIDELADDRKLYSYKVAFWFEGKIKRSDLDQHSDSHLSGDLGSSYAGDIVDLSVNIGV